MFVRLSYKLMFGGFPGAFKSNNKSTNRKRTPKQSTQTPADLKCDPSTRLMMDALLREISNTSTPRESCSDCATAVVNLMCMKGGVVRNRAPQLAMPLPRRRHSMSKKRQGYLPSVPRLIVTASSERKVADATPLLANDGFIDGAAI
jgi:hypothetical protein